MSIKVTQTCDGLVRAAARLARGARQEAPVPGLPAACGGRRCSVRRLTWFVDRCANGANTRYAFGTKLAAQEFAAQQGKLLMRTQGHADGHTAASLSDCRDEVAPEPTATTTGPQIGSECPGCPLPGDRPECCHDRPEESA